MINRAPSSKKSRARRLTISRREWLRAGSLAVGAAFASAAAPRPSQSARRPNILWLVSDDHAAYVTGCYGNRVIRTPNLDRLAAEGIRFDRAYCNSPLCSASRQSFLTGRYPRTVGVSTLQGALPDDEVTLAELLRDAGYATAAFGKMHFNNNLKHGFDLRVDMPDYQRWLKAKGGPKPVPADIEVLGPWRPFQDPARVWLNSRNLPSAYFAEDAPSMFIAQEAAKFLAAPHDKPFFLMVSFYEPHSPYHYPVEYRGRHKPDEFPVYTPGPDDDDQIPAIFRDLTDAEKRGIQAAYYTSTEFMDSCVGVVLDALDRAGLADNTLVIYIGDNGYQLGQHGRFEKHCMFEESVRQPLLVRWPGQIAAGASTAALTEFVDIVPTLLECCTVRVPQSVQGRSFRSLLTGKSNRHRDHVIVEYGHNEELMVRDERYKCVFIRGKRERDDGYSPQRPLRGNTIRLFDELNDPGEVVNLAHRPDHQERIQRYLQILANHVRKTDRQPENVPHTADPMALLDYGAQPRDKEIAGQKK